MTWNNIITARKITFKIIKSFIWAFSNQRVIKVYKIYRTFSCDFDEVDFDCTSIYSRSKNKYPRYKLEIQRKVNNSKVEKIADFFNNIQSNVSSTQLFLFPIK
jgi:hypothetical protein